MADHVAQAAEVAKEFEYWNAAGALIVHAAIALADAITVKIGGVKSSGDDHALAARLLEQVVALDQEGKKAIGHSRSILHEKHLVSYSGEIYRQEHIRRMWRHLDRFRNWSGRLLVA